MKKSLYNLCILAAMTSMAMVACSKVDEPIGPNEDPEVNETPETPTEDPDKTEGEYTVFAEIENAIYTKTSLGEADDAGNRQVSWTAKDAIKIVYNGGSTTAVTDSEGTSASFSFDAPAGDIWMTYPSTAETSLNEGVLSMTIPAEQDGSFAKHGYLVTKANTAQENVLFYNACSMFKIVVADPSIKKAVIKGNNEEPVAGVVSYNWTSANEVPTFDVTGATETSLTVTFDGVGEYLVAALPGLTLENGVTINFYRENDEPAAGNATTSSLTVARASIASFGSTDAICNRYVSATASGEGNGRTPQTAWNATQLAAFLINEPAIDATKQNALNGLTIRLAAGTYNLDTAFDARLTTKNLSIIGETGTILNGNGHQVLISNKDERDNTTLKFENITFTGGVMSTDHGGVIKHRNGTIIYKNCTFTGNKQTNEKAEKNAGVFNLYHKANAIVENCYFYNNTSTGAGGVVYMSQPDASIRFTGCQFGDGTEANQNTATNGGVASFTKGTVTFENCTFDKNIATGSGGVIHLPSGSIAKVTISNCTFTNNQAKYAGVGALYDGTTILSGNKFISTTATGNSGVFLIKGSANVTDNSSTFQSNTASTWGGAVVVEGTATVKFEGSSFGVDGDASKKNTAGSGGGAMNLNGGTVTLVKCGFYGNESKDGAAIRRGESDTDCKLTIQGCEFKNNNATVNAGAIFFEKGTLTIEKASDGTRNLFHGNTTTYVGALALCGTAVATVSDTDFVQNKVVGTQGYLTNYGGAVNVNNTAAVSFENCLFDTNSTTQFGGAIAALGASPVIKANKCTFKDNKAAKQGGAIANASDNSIIYLNSCVFTGNHTDANYGTTIQLHQYNGVNFKATLCMNNVTFADNTFTPSGNGQQSAWINMKGLKKLVLSNSSLIGATRNKNGIAKDTNPNLLRFDGTFSGGDYLINNIIVQTPETGTFYSSDMKNSTITGYYNKMSTLLNGDYFKAGEGGATDFIGTSAYFGGLNYVAGTNPSWDNCYWSWNGTLAQGSNTDKATLVNVNAKIQEADADFYAWLSGIGALNTDGRGKQRGEITWPGAYDGTNN